MRVARAPARLPIDQLAEAIEEGHVFWGDRDLRQRWLESEGCQFPCGGWEEIDADSDRPDVGGRLEYPAGNPAPVQRKPKRQSTNAGPDDDDFVLVSFRPP